MDDRNVTDGVPRTGESRNRPDSLAGAPQTPPAAGSVSNAPSRAPYHRETPHVSQAPINDDGIDYLHDSPRRPATAPGRKHMGVATSDPQYLPPTGTSRRPGRPSPAQSPRRQAPAPQQVRTQPDYSRYLETQKPGKSIFTSRYERSRRRSFRMAAILLVIVLIVLALVWFFVLS